MEIDDVNNEKSNNELSTSKIKIEPKKNFKKIDNNNNDTEVIKNKFQKKINTDIAIDTFYINKDFNFDKNDIQYYWEKEEFITIYKKKSESKNLVYLVCSKRGYNNDKCKGKAKFSRNNGKVIIYEKCNNEDGSHHNINFDYFYELYQSNSYKNINMNLKLYQKFYTRCLYLDNKIKNYTEAIEIFQKKFPKIDYILTEMDCLKIKSHLSGSINNLSLEDLCLNIKHNNKDIIIDSYTIKSEYYNKLNKNSEMREQKIIIIGHCKMIEYLHYNKAKQFGIDCTFKIFPRSFKPYKLMTIYALDNNINKTYIAAFICLKFIDYNSLVKIFSLLRAIYNFSPISINTDFDMALIKSFKNWDIFIKKPYIICSLFHLSQSIIRKFKKLDIIKKN